MTEREEELARLLAEALRQNEVLLRENTLLRQRWTRWCGGFLVPAARTGRSGTTAVVHSKVRPERTLRRWVLPAVAPSKAVGQDARAWAAFAGAPSRRRRSHRSGRGQSPAAGLALHWPGSQRATGLPARPLLSPLNPSGANTSYKTERDRPPVVAPLPDCLQERGLAAPGLLAHVLVSKYCDHLPLYRQEHIYQQRHGLPLPRQTGAGPVGGVGGRLAGGPIYEQIRTGVLARRICAGR